MSVSLGYEGKNYYFHKKRMVDKIYDEYVDKGYDVKKMTLKNGDDENSAILIRGEYDKDNLFQPHKLPLLNKDSIGAKTGGNSKPQFLLKNKSNNFTYGFINLNQIITFKYKYRVTESWGSYIKGDTRPIYTTTELTFTSWESAFPLETDLICSFGRNSFTLPAGKSSGYDSSSSSSSSGSSGSSGSSSGIGGIIGGIGSGPTSSRISTYYYNSENIPAGGLDCVIMVKIDNGADIICNDVTNDNWEKKVPESIRGTLAIKNPDEWRRKAWHGPFVWTGENYRKMSVTYLDAYTKKWRTEEKEDYNGTRKWYSYPGYPSWSSLPVSFTVPGGMILVNEKKYFSKTYIYRAIRGGYGSGTASENYYSYTYYTAKGSKETENEVSFSFTYENSV